MSTQGTWAFLSREIESYQYCPFTYDNASGTSLLWAHDSYIATGYILDSINTNKHIIFVRSVRTNSKLPPLNETKSKTPVAPLED